MYGGRKILGKVPDYYYLCGMKFVFKHLIARVAGWLRRSTSTPLRLLNLVFTPGRVEVGQKVRPAAWAFPDIADAVTGAAEVDIIPLPGLLGVPP